PISPATRSASVRLISATTTDAPSRAISRAVASPMPLPAPVTIATLPSRRPNGREYVTALPGLTAPACCRPIYRQLLAEPLRPWGHSRTPSQEAHHSYVDRRERTLAQHYSS